ncbi:TIGR00730 family Rossman fold protein [Synechococcus sp. CS-1324]|uniref:LOG family protein n=1 Tax=unclassified Synechococcus TaxID=2626047 RepID=UPI000DB032EF|nr:MULTISPECIES: TIGR00730 family Rossman fold protein [unclassified Synechococcus]MCT0214148.1 TIGR00730 family Rossman fold protein [Synechococcus sp. CS-1326]MCT0231385.1 TIGR00730 family Rossman fold protein [Synechococcus sp. CS-1324]MCT0232478.1 TIGR00730 family Rossman fold protein [Synechococcus sp. CS-1327]PZV03284.1 MAG: TIGR00730 family Rossman fold protein [Cyanobium sp.]
MTPASHSQSLLIQQSLATIERLGDLSVEHEDWLLILGTLQDIEEAISVFQPHRRTRKITVFGSARTAPGTPAYSLAEQLAAAATAAGFEVITGAGGGVMEAANRGAGAGRSFGLNVQLPFEQEANPFISDAEGRLVHFRYFFTRKLFFLRESDALVVLPGGFGTLDELFEALTLIQTGRTPPIPLVLLAPEDDHFWGQWQRQLQAGLAQRGLIAPEDLQLLRQAHSASEAVALIRGFYRVFHALRSSDHGVELFLHAPLPGPELVQIQQRFADLSTNGRIEAAEGHDEAGAIRPCLRLDFDQRRVGRLYQLIDHLNGLDLPRCPDLQHPEQRLCSLST